METLELNPAYRIETARTVLRCWEPADAGALKCVIDANLEHLRPWMPWVRHEPESLDGKIQRLRRFRGEFDLSRDFVYGVFTADERRILGSSGLHTRAGEGALEIGYWIRSDSVGCGLATEVAGALARCGLELHHVDRVEIHCDAENRASMAVARKLGFTQEGLLRQRMRTGDGAARDEAVWTLLAEEYPASACAGIALRAYDVVGRPLL